MSKLGSKLSPESIERLRISHLGQPAWNKGSGGCKRGHDIVLWQENAPTPFCLDCKRENGAGWRARNRDSIRLKGRAFRYQLSVVEVDALWMAQCGLCAICGEMLGETARIDHSHVTGVVRGILCVGCNSGIGLLQDSPAVLAKACQYLLEHGSG